MKKKLSLKPVHIMHLTTKLEFSGSEVIIHNMVKYHPDSNDRVTVCSLMDKVPYLRCLQEDNITVFVLGRAALNGFQACCLMPWYLIKLVKLLKKEKVTVLTIHSFLAGIIGRLAAVFVRTPLVIRYLNNMELDLPSRIWSEKVFRYLTDHYVAISRGVMDYARNKAGLKDSQIEVVYAGVDVPVIDRITSQPAKVRKELGLLAADLIIGAVGRLTEQKGMSYAIQAMPLVLQEFPTAKLLIIGDGPLKDDLQQEAKKLALTEKILFLGVRDDTLALFPVFDLFILPSLWEGLGLVVVEAMLKGIPVIASDIPGVDELVQPGLTGLLVPPENSKILAEKIIGLLKDKEIQKIFVKEGRCQMENKFTAENMALGMNLVYQRMRSY
ncbi:MAG: glycosyltransferase family 4 protein [bacterium]|nr:glycosyltransferase family 4 protein [bacterium]MDD5756555.1 glycosyltransferase family 4 protein [bacterium]